MTTSKIPKGWKKLWKGTVLHEGDKFDICKDEWSETSCAGLKVGEEHVSLCTYIRRITKKKISQS